MIDRDAEERAVVQSMSLLSTLSSAMEVAHSIRNRRLGCDPSEQQEPSDVLPSLAENAADIDARLIAIRTSLVAAEREVIEGVSLIRHMNDLLLVSGIARLLHLMHQRLLSLYPAISGDLVEEARRLGGVCSSLMDEENDEKAATYRFAQDVEAFLVGFRTETKHIKS
jgi:hypothetical protein